MTTPSILVLTSSETLALRLRLLAEGEGIAVRTAATGQQALDMPLAGVRLLVMDGRPPGRSVEDLIKRLRAAAGDAVDILHIGGGGKLGSKLGGKVVTAGDWEGIRDAMRQAMAAGDGEAGQEDDPAFATALSGARILVVDDSVTYREYLRGELQREGAEVRVTGDVDEVAALLGTGRFDCVIVDLVLPGLDGASLCRQLARLRRRQGQNFFLLVMSSREAENDLLRSLSAGADDFIGKSKSPRIALAKLRAIMRRKRIVDSLGG